MSISIENLFSKFKIVGFYFVVVTLTIFMWATSFGSVSAQTDETASIAELRHQLEILMAEVARLQAQLAMRERLLHDSKAERCIGRVGPILRFGASGEEVKTLQKNLHEVLGLSTPTLSISGVFDQETREVLQRYQVKRAIVSAGTAETTGFGQLGPRTRMMLAYDCSKAEAKEREDKQKPEYPKVPDKEDTDKEEKAVKIERINPVQGSIGTEVRLYGRFARSGNVVKFGDGYLGPFMPDQSGVITFRLSDAMSVCHPDEEACIMIAWLPEPGKTYPVSVISNSVESNKVRFKVVDEIIDPTDPTPSKLFNLSAKHHPSYDSPYRVIASFNRSTPCTSYAVAWGDGEHTSVSVDRPDLTCSQVIAPTRVEHEYQKPGRYKVTLRMSDRVETVEVIVGEVEEDIAIVPSIDSVRPWQGPLGTEITILGKFSKTRHSIQFGEGYIHGIVSDGRSLSFVLPDSLSVCGLGAELCRAKAMLVTPGVYPLLVINEKGESRVLRFQVTR